jgi:transposase
MSGKRRRFSADFKLSAVKQMEEAASIAALARTLGVRRKFLYLWKDQYEKGGEAALKRPPGRPPGSFYKQKQPPGPSPSQLRIAQLERLLGQKQAELDFLKRTFEYVRGAAASPTGGGGKESIAASKARSHSKAKY